MTQTVVDLLKQFDLDLELPDNILNMNVEGEFNSVEQKEGYFFTGVNPTSYKKYGYFEFRGQYCFCRIVPDCQYQIISIYKVIGDEFPKAIGKTYSADGKVTAIT